MTSKDVTPPAEFEHELHDRKATPDEQSFADTGIFQRIPGIPSPRSVGPLAAGVLVPLGLVLPMSIGAILMSLSTIIVAANAEVLRTLDLRPASHR